MYERSAIVLERCFNELLGFNEEPNIKMIYNYYTNLVEKTREYQTKIDEENRVISEFDQTASEIRKIQQEQKKIYKSNAKLEDERNKLFEDLDEDPEKKEGKLSKIETTINDNNESLKEVGKNFITATSKFMEKQEERNKCSKERRLTEKEYIDLIGKINDSLSKLDKAKLVLIKTFITEENDEKIDTIVEKMLKNGKGEKIPFDENAIRISVVSKYELNQKLVECYAYAYDKAKRLLSEINKDNLNIEKHEKIKRDLEIKMNFLVAQNNYIVDFLDYERMSAINGQESYKQLMEEACKDFKLDMQQFNNLYQLLIKEVSGKVTKKAYAELYDKNYLKNVVEKQKKVENEINNINVNTGTIINSSFWRTQEIKNIFNVFLNEISEKLGKDMSEYQLEETEEEEVEEEDNEIKAQDEIFKKEVSDEDLEKYDESYFDFGDDIDDEEYFDFGDDDDEDDDDDDDDDDEEYDDEIDNDEDDDDDETDDNLKDNYDEDDNEEYDDEIDNDEDNVNEKKQDKNNDDDDEYEYIYDDDDDDSEYDEYDDDDGEDEYFDEDDDEYDEDDEDEDDEYDDELDDNTNIIEEKSDKKSSKRGNKTKDKDDSNKKNKKTSKTKETSTKESNEKVNDKKEKNKKQKRGLFNFF